MNDPIESDLLRRAQGGDYDAFEQLHARLTPPLLRFARRLLGDCPEAEDVVQDTFIALYVHLGGVQPAEHLRPYVYRIARNACYDVLRREGRRTTLSLDDDTPMLTFADTLADERAPAPDDAAHWLLLNMEVQQAVDRLPDAQRQALILYSEADMSYAEIAEVMDVSVGTIKSRLFHAKRNLRAMVRPEILRAIEEQDDAREPSVARADAAHLFNLEAVPQ